MPRFAISLVAVLLSAALPAIGQTQWKVANTWHIGGEGSWDYVTVDPGTHHLFVPRSTHTQVIDGISGTVLGDIPGQKTAHGVALVPALNRGFISDGGNGGGIEIFDLKSYAVLGRINTVPDTDGIIYDPSLKRVLAVSGDAGVLIVLNPEVDPKNGKVESMIPLDGAPEFLAADHHGKVFINLENKNLLAVVDVRAKKVIARWPVAPGGQPVGLAFDEPTHRLFIGCRNPQKLVVMSSEDGKILGSAPIGAGVDAVSFDRGQALASCRDGSLVVTGEKNGTFAVEQTVKTPEGARTNGLDPVSHSIYLPTAEFEKPPAGSTARPHPKPGTFVMVQVTPAS